MRVGELWGDFLKSAPTIAAKIAEAKISDAWTEVVGPAVASYTMSMNMNKGILYVSVSSSVIRHEILMRRESLRQALNHKVGVNVVKSIIVK